MRHVDKSLLAVRAECESAVTSKVQAKAKKEAEEAEKKKLLDEKSKVNHLQMFRTDGYKEWNEDGIPTRDANGEEVTKSKRKKFVKEWERQRTLHEEWLTRQGKGEAS
jgi:cysteinyl-tRNA synthetase